MTISQSSLSRLRAVARMLALLVACGAVSGCELDRPNFQMNSNSPAPFFGIDLLPRRKTTSLVSPQAGQQVVCEEAHTGSIETAADTPSRHRFWQRNAKSLDRTENSIVLPLLKPNLDQPIDRGPIELMP